MDTETVTLSEFLLARIAEDEAAVDVHGTFGPPGGGDPSALPDAPLGRVDYDEMRIGPARVLAECEVKRRIVEMHESSGDLDEPECQQCSWYELYEGFNNHTEPWPCPTLRILALPYADHPDYRAEWRP